MNEYFWRFWRFDQIQIKETRAVNQLVRCAGCTKLSLKPFSDHDLLPGSVYHTKAMGCLHAAYRFVLVPKKVGWFTHNNFLYF
jgi:hypothetical protein